MFKITKDTFGEDNADIAAALVQKIANTTQKLSSKKIWLKIVDRPDYKHILQKVKKGLSNLTNRHFVDTFFSIGKMHKNHLPEEAYKPLFPFFDYMIEDFLKESKVRISQI